MKLAIATAVASSALFATSALAQQILKNEPPAGGMRPGEVVYVDNGRCPKGQIMKVAGGAFSGNRNGGNGGVARQKECVPRP